MRIIELSSRIAIMKTSTAAVLGLAGLVAANCNNNCGRAVTGTARKVPSLEDRQSQCSAFLTSTTTITPPLVTLPSETSYPLTHPQDDDCHAGTDLEP